MRRLHFVLALSMIVSLFPSGVQAGSRPAVGEKHLSTVYVNGGTVCLDRKTRRELDRIAPDLTSLGPGHIVKIEGRSRRGAEREERVRNSLYLAGQAQRYLSERHGVKLDIFVAAAPESNESSGDFVRIAVFPDVFTAVHVSRGGAEP